MVSNGFSGIFFFIQPGGSKFAGLLGFNDKLRLLRSFGPHHSTSNRRVPAEIPLFPHGLELLARQRD